MRKHSSWSLAVKWSRETGWKTGVEVGFPFNLRYEKSLRACVLTEGTIVTTSLSQ